MKKNILLVCLIWMLLITASFFWNYRNAKIEQYNLSMQTARSSFQQIVLFRSWNAAHGGVYVPVDNNTSPNPYLEIPMRDITVRRGLTLTMINPAYMTRQVSEIAMMKEGIKFHITSLKPIRPENKPTGIEEIALKEFESGVPEKGKILEKEKNGSFFYMAPLITEKSCLKCHAKQGYREGDIRGGISVTLPFLPEIPFLMLTGGHLFIFFIGLTGIIFAGNRLSKAYSTIRRQAVFDALTGIPNRHSFSERILTEYNRSMRDSYPLSVIMGDIDNFKLYNDTYGHAAGDECLKSVAKAIEKALKRPGDFCARYGGEEFIIILPATDQEGTYKVSEDIRASVLGLNIKHEKSFPEKKVTISLGFATKEAGETLHHEKLLKMADDALYIAKDGGRNRVVNHHNA
ncbi:MAG TPA: diguanylate cyclase [Spirochaetota bacterium]|nr:diguanylate cyclase [Spirochaetota bacterium]HPJ35508.1 diguanylate cyclase [Spirochaetota bacterium]